MTSTYYFNDLGFSYLKLSFAEWQGIPEAQFYDFIAGQDDPFWLLALGDVYLLDYVCQVKLIRVDNTFFKLDGKQRKELWLSGRAAPPKFVIAQIFDMTKEQFSDLNNKTMLFLKNDIRNPDLIKQAYSELGLDITSERLRGGLIAETLNIALRGKHRLYQDKLSTKEAKDINILKAVGVFRDELLILDAMNPNPDVFLSGVLAGALIMLGLDKNITDFLTALNGERGEKRGDMFDPVLLLLKAISKYKPSNQAKRRRLSVELCRLFIQAVLIWEEGVDSPNYWRMRVSSGVDHMPYIRALKQHKGISEAWDL